MLNKSIHFTNQLNTCDRNYKDYSFSVDTILDIEDSYSYIMVELDSILEYVGVSIKEATELLQFNKYLIDVVSNKFNFIKETVQGTTKSFISYEYINVYLSQILNEQTRDGFHNDKLQTVLENLDLAILNEWENEVVKIKEVIHSLDISYISKEFKRDGYLKDIHGLLTMFSNRV